jgi:hypothetical protein
MTHSIPPGLDGSVWEKCHTHDLQMRHTTLLVAGMSAGRRRPRAPGVSSPLAISRSTKQKRFQSLKQALSSVGWGFLAAPFSRVLSLDGVAVSKTAPAGLPPVRLASHEYCTQQSRLSVISNTTNSGVPGTIQKERPSRVGPLRVHRSVRDKTLRWAPL